MKKIILSILLLQILLSAECRNLSSSLILNTSTNLMWSLEYDAKTFTDAKSSCASSTNGGYSDWKLPNINELITESYEHEDSPCYDDTSRLWSSTLNNQLDDNAYYLISGRVGSAVKTGGWHYRCVRLVN